MRFIDCLHPNYGCFFLPLKTINVSSSLPLPCCCPVLPREVERKDERYSSCLFWVHVHFGFEVVAGVTFDFISFSELVHESKRKRVCVVSWFIYMTCTPPNNLSSCFAVHLFLFCSKSDGLQSWKLGSSDCAASLHADIISSFSCTVSALFIVANEVH